jgi:hypothetical protein
MGLYGAIGEGKVLVFTGNAIVHDNFDVLSHDVQYLAQREGGADAVSVGSRVRSHDESLTSANLL